MPERCRASCSSVYTWAGDWYPGTSTTSAGTATGTLYLSLSNNGAANPSTALVYTDTYLGVNYELTANSFSSISAVDVNDVISISGPGTLTVAGFWTAQCSFTLTAQDSGVVLNGHTYSFTMYFNCGSWFTGTKAGVQGTGANINVVPGSGPACGNTGTARPPPPAKMAPPPPATCPTSTTTTPGRASALGSRFAEAHLAVWHDPRQSSSPAVVGCLGLPSRVHAASA